MAQKVKLGAGIAIDGEKEFKRVLASINSEARVLASEMKKITSEFEGNANSMDALTAKNKVLNEQVDKQKERVDALRQALENAQKQYGENDTRTDAWKTALNNAEVQLNRLNSELKQNEQYLDEAKKSTDKVATSIDGMGREVKDATDDVDNMGVSLKDIVAGGLIVEGIKEISELFVDLAKEAAGFTQSAQQGINTFAAATGTAKAELSEYKDVMKELYSDNMGEDMNDIASAMTEIKQQLNDVDASNIKDVTHNALLLRDTFDMDIKEQIRAVDMMMQQFGISSKEAFNLIAQGAQEGLNKNDDLLDSINEYSVHYRQMGYSAEDLFNSLANGTEAGTFSVDKLGDAMKELGIRTKDTAKSTIEGFNLLGYGMTATEEDIEKTSSKISQLEKNLKYAKLEQEAFNSKTSELTRLKNADKIKQYSDELEIEKEKLKELTASTDKSAGSIEELQKRFAAGGETARQATEEVITKLLAMDNQVARNQAGVALFGTMWEDLGEDGIKALLDVNGEISVTKNALEDINDIRYDDVGSAFNAITRTIQTEVEPAFTDLFNDVNDYITDNKDEIKDLADNSIRKLGDAFSWCADHATELKVTGSAVAGVFVMIKTASAFESITTSIAGTIQALKGAEAAQKAFNLAQKANVVGLVLGVATALAGTIWSLASANEEAANSTDGLASKQDQLLEESKALNEEIANSLEQSKERVTAIDQEYKNVSKLKDELSEMVTKNGKIKEGYEDQAKYIAEQLNEKLGMELEISNNILKSSGETVESRKALNKEIDKTIAKKEAERMLDSESSQNIENQKELKKAREELAEQTEELNRIQKDIDKAQKELEKREGLELLQSAAMGVLPSGTVSNSKKEKLDGLKKEYKEISNEAKKTESTIKNLNTEIANYAELDKAIASGNVEKMRTAMFNMVNSMKTSANATTEELKKQYKDVDEQYKKMKKAAENGIIELSKADLKFYKEIRKVAKDELKKSEKMAVESGENTGQKYADALGSKTDEVKESAGSLATAAANKLENSKEKAKEAGKYFSGGFAEGMWSGVLETNSAAIKLGQSATKSLKKSINSNSPSKDSMKVGEDFGEGGVIGIKNKIKDVEAASREFGKAQNAAYKNSLMSGINSANQVNKRAAVSSTSESKSVEYVQPEAASGDLYIQAKVNEGVLFETVYKDFRKAKNRDSSISMA